MTVEVELYGKPDCGLCDKARALLAALAGRYPHRLTEIDITADEGLFRRYWDIIPVIRIGGRVTLQAPIEAEPLAAALAEAGKS